MGKIGSFLLILLGFLGASLCFASLTGSLAEQQIIERIKPLGEVTITGAQPKTAQPETPAIADVGHNRYEQTCKMCHETGLADAPKLGDKTAWKPRIDQGMETLLKHAIHGLKAMPPKGGCSNCSDEEIQKAIEYMISKSK